MLEEFEPGEEAESPLALPPIPPPPRDEPGQLSSGREVQVRAFEFEGSTVFTQDELAGVVAPWAGRAISSEELLDAVEAVTAFYIRHGYVTSGAVVPDQGVDDGVVRIQVVEGGLGDVRVEGTRHFRSGFFRSRLLRAGRAPLNVRSLEEELQLLQRDRWVSQVRARLIPGEVRGESLLLLSVDEARPYALALVAANDESPAIGAEGGIFSLDVANLLGRGDVLTGVVHVTEGLREYDAFYEVPLTAAGTRLRLAFQDSNGLVVESPFDVLEIQSDTRTYGISLRHPFYRSPSAELWLGLLGEWRDSETRWDPLGLGNECVQFQPGVVDCTPVVSVLRTVADWTHRSTRDVIAARSTLSVGLDILGATTSVVPRGADGEFVAWLGQAQWAHRLFESVWPSESLARLDVQVADDPLLVMEKIAVGGIESVRGYRENELVRDNAVVGSVEFRVPVWREPLGRPLLQVVPFVDFAHAWDNGIGLPSNTLVSMGMGLRVSPWQWLKGEIYWGGQLTDGLDRSGDLQDHGISFRITVTPFDALP